MIDVTVLYCADGYVSTSIAPLEIFHAAGLMWNMCVGRPAEPYFRITTASVDGAAVTCGAGVQVLPDKPLDAVEKTDLVFVPTAGMNVDVLLAQNAAAIPWLQRLHAEGTLIAGVCTGVAILAEAGLLDGRRATTHWAVAEIYRRRFPKVDWQTHLCVTEDRGVLCGGGLYASIDLALYVVEKLCGREVAIGCAKSLVLQMPRTFQTSFAILPIGRDHGDPAVRRVEDWLRAHFHEEIDFDHLAQEAGSRRAPSSAASRPRPARRRSPISSGSGRKPRNGCSRGTV